MEDGTFTVRDRDSMQQERLTLQQLKTKIEEALY
jgi:glycyl-tRNA synthetase (class II)